LRRFWRVRFRSSSGDDSELYDDVKQSDTGVDDDEDDADDDEDDADADDDEDADLVAVASSSSSIQSDCSSELAVM
jgi:hypothetical protein